jgi:hypothetical protein
MILAIFKTTLILVACYIIFRFISKKIAQKSTYLAQKSLSFSTKGLKNEEISFLLDEDFPTLDLPKGVYVLPPNAADPSLRKKGAKVLEV